jgi:hypothetical protein
LELSHEEGGQPKKVTKKGVPNPARPPHPLIGVPTFRKLELSLKAAGRKRKDGSKKSHGGGDPVVNDVQLVSQPPAIYDGDFDLYMELPVQNSGLNHIFANGWGFVPEEESAVDGEEVAKEARILLGIQKKVGFSFEGGEEEIQSKLVELEKKDKEKNVELVQERGYQ